MDTRTANPLGYENIGKLIFQFALPTVISMLVNSLYNMVDQIFIGRGVGMLGNAATNVAFPISTLCISAALVMGIGGAANYNLRSGEGREQEARRLAGCSLTMLLVIGCIIMAIVLVFLKPLLVLLEFRSIFWRAGAQTSYVQTAIRVFPWRAP